MPAIFIHGVPDTASMWDPLLAALDRSDALAVSLPGFGVDPPAGWTATKDEYAAWLESELESVGAPVDLVAHDWGAILAQRVASVRPDLIRTLACGSGPLDRDYEWHPAAQAWQTPDIGEQILDGMLAMEPDALATLLIAGGAPADLAAEQAASVDRRMADCILALYRSAVTVGAEWQPAIEAMEPRPAVVFHGADDPYVTAEIAERQARRLGGEFVVYDGCQHWWARERTNEVAATLARLWS